MVKKRTTRTRTRRKKVNLRSINAQLALVERALVRRGGGRPNTLDIKTLRSMRRAITEFCDRGSGCGPTMDFLL